MPPLKNKRILLKLSGEMLLGKNSFGIDQSTVSEWAAAIASFKQRAGVQLGIVIGGGNIFRGINLMDNTLPRTPADQIGMLATIMNGLVLQQAFEYVGAPCRVLSALECPKVVESYTWRLSRQYLHAGDIVIFVGGTGNPYFTTDTAAAMRANEIDADMLLKATKVDGVYNKDPVKHSDAVKYSTLTYAQMLAEKLAVMDATAVTLCQSNQLPIFVFNMQQLKNREQTILENSELGTLIT